MSKKFGSFFVLFAVALFSASVLPQITHASSVPVIYSAFPTTINNTDATITWTTDSLSTSTVNYGTTSGYGLSSSSAAATLSHSITLTGLTASTTYHFSVSSGNSNGQSSSTDQTFTTVYSCTYYVDSVSGNDANAGTSSDFPLQHLAAVPIVSNGATICLRRGSTFTDTLYVGIQAGTSVNNATVRDYGPLNLPIPMIDDSNTIASTSWSLTPGTSNVYQATVQGPGLSTITPYGTYTVGASLWINVFECKSAPCTPQGSGGNDDFLSNQTSTSSVSSNAGSYYIPGMTSTVNPASTTALTIYITPSDGSNPATNGYTYTYSNRFYGLELTGTGDTVINIASKKNSYNDGSIVQYTDGGNATFTGIEADQGGKHNAYCTGGCTVNNSKFVDEYYPGAGNMFVAFDQNGSGLPITLNDDTFLSGVTAANNQITATYGHVGSGASFPSYIINGGLIEAINNTAGTAFQGFGATAVNEIVNGLTCINTEICIPAVATTTVSNSQSVSSTTTPFNSLLSASGPGSVTIASSTVCGDVGYNQGAVSLGAGNIGTVSSSTFYMNGLSGGDSAVVFGGSGSSLKFSNNIVDALAGTFAIWINDNSSTSTAPYIGDYNTYSTNLWQGYINGISGTSYHPLSAWQTATGQDTHSTAPATTSAQTIACTLHLLTLTGPSSGTVNNASTNFTVTPNIGYNSVGKPIGFVGTVTVSLSGTAAAGLNPITLTFPFSASTTAQTFIITPVATGTITLSEFASGATTSPDFVATSTVTYTASAVVAGAPQNVTAVAGNTQATVSFSGPASNGGSAITLYTVTSSPGNFASSSVTSPIIVTGLTNGTPYTFTVTATNSVGVSASSSASNSITPLTISTLTTSAASSISTTGATLNGAITSTGGFNASASGFIYGTNSGLTSGVSTSSLGSQTGTTTLSSAVSSLVCNTTYYFASYATNSSGTAYGPILSFATLACPVASTPVTVGSNAPEEGGGSISSSELAGILAPGPATTAYLNSLNTPSTPSAPTVPGPEPVFSRNLEIGTISLQVKSLQQFLNAQGYVVASFGPGSPGHETDTFGSLTKSALIKFQKAHGIPGTGFFGPMTRGYVGSL